MLTMKPACERCAAPLPPESTEARICSYECTWCAACAGGPLGGRCPNCLGTLERRPARARKGAPPAQAGGSGRE